MPYNGGCCSDADWKKWINEDSKDAAFAAVSHHRHGEIRCLSKIVECFWSDMHEDTVAWVVSLARS